MTSAYSANQLSTQGLTGGLQSGTVELEAVLDESIRGDVFGFFESAQNSNNTIGWGKGKCITRALDKMVS